MTKANLGLRSLALVSVLANVAFNALYEHLGLGLEDIRTLSDRYETLFTPAPFAFVIWGAIYIALIAYAIYALLASQRDVLLHDRLAPAFIALNVLGSVWIAVFTSDHPAASVVAIIAMLGCAIWLMRRVGIAAPTLARPRLMIAPFSLQLGWLSVASIASVSQACVAHGASRHDTVWAIVMLAIALALGLLVALRFADAVFPGVICWSSIALAVAQRQDSVVFSDVAIAVAALSGLASIAVIGVLISRRVGPGLPSHDAHA